MAEQGRAGKGHSSPRSGDVARLRGAGATPPRSRSCAPSQEEVSAALWFKRLRETNNDAFLPLFWDEHRYLVLKGGGGSGKSIFAGRKVLERVTTEEGHRYLVCRKVARTLRESCFEQLKNQAYEYYPDEIAYMPRGKGGDMTMRFRNGSEILFAGLDDVEKLKSIYNITGIWIEEASEVLESDFNQLDIRLRTKFNQYLQIILSFNPISVHHWLKKRFFDFDIKDPAERERAMERTRTHESTYKDNRFLEEEAVRTLESFKETDEYYYQVYALGMWGVTGKTVFDAKSIARRLEEKIRPAREGLFQFTDDGLRLSGIAWADEKDGPVRVFREPEAGVPYVIGADTAGEGSDFFAAQVLDNRTGAQVAVLHGHFDEDVFARQLFCLGMHYNTALIGPEANFSTYPVMELERLGYPKLYVRESVDDYTHKIRHSYGFVTSPKTRPIIIAGLIKAVREDVSIVSDEATLLEMLSFVRNEDTLRPEAEPGGHDDLVLALAIAHHIRPQQSYLVQETPAQGVKWTADMWEDYENASPEGRKMLIERWGRPKR
ncbi:MAG: PBSX family phage terminase large subunit [Clostridiales bacterium]|nr:PBSX family phage terminase large subunit [Clostridiales bacterium]